MEGDPTCFNTEHSILLPMFWQWLGAWDAGWSCASRVQMKAMDCSLHAEGLGQGYPGSSKVPQHGRSCGFSRVFGRTGESTSADFFVQFSPTHLQSCCRLYAESGEEKGVSTSCREMIVLALPQQAGASGKLLLAQVSLAVPPFSPSSLVPLNNAVTCADVFTWEKLGGASINNSISSVAELKHCRACPAASEALLEPSATMCLLGRTWFNFAATAAQRQS